MATGRSTRKVSPMLQADHSLWSPRTLAFPLESSMWRNGTVSGRTVSSGYSRYSPYSITVPSLTSLESSKTSKLGLGVNVRTGRLQWCPGFTCCKFLLILPVIMLPLSLVLMLLLRFDGILWAFQVQQRPYDESAMYHYPLRPFYFEDYDTSISGNLSQRHHDNDLFRDVDDITAITDSGENRAKRARLERIRRCLAYKFEGLSETMDVEDRDIMKDARTSFLPYDTTVIPRECLLTPMFGNLEKTSNIMDYQDIEEPLQEEEEEIPDSYSDMKSLRLKREGGTPLENDQEVEHNDQSKKDDDERFIESTSALQSFWNEQGTKQNIRQAQAHTMLKYMDVSVNPCTDFYKFACGNWEKHHPIPKDKAGFDTFEMLRENLDVVLKELLESHTLDETPIKKVQPVASNDIYTTPMNDEILIHAMKKKDADTNMEIEIEKQEIRRHIVSRRNVLEDLLMRYKRQLISRNNSLHKRRLVYEDTAFITNSNSSIVTEKSIKVKNKLSKENGSNELKDSSKENSNGNQNNEGKDSSADKKGCSGEGEIKCISHTIPVSKTAGLYESKKSKEHDDADDLANDAQLKARQLYQSCTNIKLLQKRGIQPLTDLINSLGGWPLLNEEWNGRDFDWLNLTAHLRRYNNDVLIVQWVGPDIKNSDENVIQFDQTNLGLPTREYYLQEVNSKYLQAYQRFMSDVMHKLGANKVTALKTAANLIDFETQLASITAPAEKRLNVTKLYKRLTLKELRSQVPQIDWIRYLIILQDRDVSDHEEVVIYAIDYMNDLVRLLTDTPPRTIANYLMWRFIRHRINNVDDRFDDTKQVFYHALFGREEAPSRWKVCISQVNTNMGMALGAMFVRKYFDENSKQDTLKMTHELQQSFREILKSTDWLDSRTKQLAELKVNAMSLKIGYPDFILNRGELNAKYAGIQIDPEKYFENTLNVLLHTTKMEQNKLNEAVNKTTWQTAPAIVNAYYSRNKNQIMFPAGILQPPFYHRYFPRCLNFGGIGVVIGHELTHGFDDKGRLFDRTGSIHKWWSDAAIKGFDERARCIISQYGNYTVGEVGIALNGESTQGENIADNGGIRQAFHAYKNWLRSNPDAVHDERLPGLNMTGEQLFFLNFGQVWCGAMRPEAVRNKLNTAIHSPGRFRVIGTLSNSLDFSKHYECPVDSPMNPSRKCSVW